MNMGIKYRTVDDIAQDALEAEARRINTGPDAVERQLGLRPDAYVFTCAGNADEVLRRARETMRLVNKSSSSGQWPTEAEWFHILPAWFVDACESEDAADDDTGTALHEMTDAERRAMYLADKWKLTHWVSCMEPEAREWLWWSAELRDADTIHVVVDRLGDPSGLGSPAGLWWLFSASGAGEYDEARHSAVASGKPR